jgi:dynein intermediate chain 1
MLARCPSIVYWNKDEPGKPINFFSVSSDGRVTNWIMNKNDLINEEVVELKLTTTPARKEKEAEELKADAPKLEEETAVVGLAGGCCFDFNKYAPHLFIVGTEEGAIQLYSKAYNTQLVRNFEGHHMAVYSVRWNTFHPNIFLSCSAGMFNLLRHCKLLRYGYS